MILVSGATGTVGREVARQLAAERPVRLLARRPENISARGPAVEAVRGDYDDWDSLREALRGVQSAFLVTNRVTRADDARFVDAARAEGVRHLVKLSAAAVLDPGANDLITRWQRGNEARLRSSGLDWTFLRPRAFMSNTLAWSASVRQEQVVRALHGSSVNACVDPRDVAAVAVRALTRREHRGKAYTLTGPNTISAVEQTHVLGRVLQMPLDFEELTLPQARAQLLHRYPRPLAEALLESAVRQREGAKAEVHGTVLDVTGRPARSFQTWAIDHAEAFGGARRSLTGTP